MAAMTKVELSGVTIRRFESDLHHEDSVSATGACAQGGVDTCPEPAFFSVIGDHWRIAACPTHLFGAAHDCCYRGRVNAA